MSSYHWPDIRAKAIDLFRGEQPHAATEADIVEAFETMPRTVVRLVESVGAEIRNGADIRSGWAVLRKRVQSVNGPVSDVTVTDTGEREKRASQARRWVVNAGFHFDREQDVLDELFGWNGLLRDWSEDVGLRAELLALWREHRPRGEAADLAEQARADSWLANRDQVWRIVARKRLEEREAA